MISRRITLFIFSCMFILQTLVNQGVKLSPFQWVMLAFAVGMVGAVLALLIILIVSLVSTVYLLRLAWPNRRIVRLSWRGAGG